MPGKGHCHLQRPGGGTGLDKRKEHRGNCGLGQWGRVGCREAGRREEPLGPGQDSGVHVKKGGKGVEGLIQAGLTVDLHF